MKKLTMFVLMLTMLIAVTNCHGLTKTYALANGQDDKTELDEVEVNIIKTETFVDTKARTATEIKDEITRANAKIGRVTELVATLEEELAAHYVEAEKYVFVEPEPEPVEVEGK